MNIHRRDRARVTKGAGTSASARRGAAEDGTYGGELRALSPVFVACPAGVRLVALRTSPPIPVFSEYSISN